MQPGLQIAQYRFVDRLAVGGMAEVFIAIAQGATGFEKPVVIKRLLPQLGTKPQFHQMFLDEARILASLQHGNIVQILDMGTLDGLPFLALEYVDGSDLRSILERAQDKKHSLPYALMAHIVSEVCRALDYAHRKQDENGTPVEIVHRDVNPSNVFISHEGVVKIGDFGLAQAIGKVEQSEAGIIKGKISYLSPEQSEGLKIDHRSDIFSLGTTLYEATCGRRPFVGANEPEIIGRIRMARYVMPSRIRPDFPPRLEAIIAKALQLEPQRRYETAGEMRAALQRYLQHLPEPTDDRKLCELLSQLFGKQLRTQSHLFRLPPADTLPPPMVSVPHQGPFAEYRHQDGARGRTSTSPSSAPPPMPPSALPAIEPAPEPVSPLMIEEAEAADPTAQLRSHRAAKPTRTQAQVPKARSGRGIWLIVALFLLAATVSVGVLIYRIYSPPTAQLRLTSTPSGATVTIGGVLHGQTPLSIEDLKLEKDYDLRIALRGYHPLRQRVRLRPGSTHTLEFALRPLDQELQLDSNPPNADVLVDGEMRGQTPLALSLERGKKYAIVFRKNGHVEKTVQHHADQPKAALTIVLDQAEQPKEPSTKRRRRRYGPRTTIPEGKGVLELDVAEAAKVYIDGRFVGTTPNFRRALDPGTYQLRVVPRQSDVQHRGTVTISERKIQRIHLTPPQ